jgi:hypothetical protein
MAKKKQPARAPLDANTRAFLLGEPYKVTDEIRRRASMLNGKTYTADDLAKTDAETLVHLLAYHAALDNERYSNLSIVMQAC